MIDTLAYPAEKLLPWLVEAVGSGWLALVIWGVAQVVVFYGGLLLMTLPFRRRDINKSRRSSVDYLLLVVGGFCVALRCVATFTLLFYFWPWRSEPPAGASLLQGLMEPDRLLADCAGFAGLGGRLASFAPLPMLAVNAWRLRRRLVRREPSPDSQSATRKDGCSTRSLSLVYLARLFIILSFTYAFPLGWWISSYAGSLAFHALWRFIPIPTPRQEEASA